MDEQSLYSFAKMVCDRSYSPYSEFKVGAVLSCLYGEYYYATNVENASYGLTCCAERNAIFQMIALGGSKPELCMIYTPTEKATMPCGACRQVLNEFNPTMKIISIAEKNEVTDRIDTTLDKLLPLAFGPANLG